MSGSELTPRKTIAPPTLAAKLVKARQAVGNVEKRGKNTQQNYEYVKAEDIAAAAELALLAEGLLADFEVLTARDTPIKSKSGTEGLIVCASCRLVVTDSETGESLERKATGYGSDYPGDKAIYKAMTGARKYAFIHLLGINIGDDPEETKQPEESKATGKPAADQPVGPAIAGKLVDRAWKLPGGKEKLQLAASAVAGRDVGDCTTKKKAVEGLASLTFEQAEKLDNKISIREAEGAGDE